MSSLTDIFSSLGNVQLSSLLLFVPLGGIALAAFAIHSVCSVVKERRR
jgi:hypothetical protein